MPVRLPLSRRKGFNLQAASRAINGLAAKTVARPSKWGNVFRIGTDGNQAECVSQFRIFAERKARNDRNWLNAMVTELKGKNLACWCKPGTPCHADVLIELANRESASSEC